MSNNLIPVYVGYDEREDIAYKVCEFSINKNSPQAQVLSLNQATLRDKNLYWRQPDPLSSTAFTFTRFLVPALQNYQGWAVFCDCDFVWDVNVQELMAHADDRYAVMVVKHEHAPKATVKMDGCQQSQYPRKNWSSLILWNCGHPANAAVTPDLVNRETGQYLHRFSWLRDDLIGELKPEWNFLVGWNTVAKDGTPKVYHWTEGGPWFENYRDCEFKNVWYDYLIDYATEMGKLYPAIPKANITWVTSLSREYYNYIGNSTLPTWKNLPGEVVFVWDDKPMDLGFGTSFNFWRDVASPLDPWLQEGMGGAKADRFWKKSRVQAWAARKYSGLVVWLDTDISINKTLSITKAIELLHPGDKIWGTMDAGDPLDLETGIVAFNNRHPKFNNFIREYSVGWYNGEIYKLRQPYDNHMIASLRTRYPHKSFCPHYTKWNTPDDMRKNEYCIANSNLQEYFTHHIGIINKGGEGKKKK